MSCHRPVMSLIAGTALVLSAWSDHLPAAAGHSSTALARTSITLPDGGWDVTANGLDDDGDPAFEANRDGQVEITLGEVSSIPLVTGAASDMLDNYEAYLREAFERLDRQKSLPKGIRAPKGYDCRAYRSVFMAGDAPDSVDLMCYAPYRGGARTLMVEIKDAAKAEDRAALQRALDAIRLVD